ncbi:MAG: glycosyltransferase family 9 protein [Elainellaceae cyanobacterium]
MTVATEIMRIVALVPGGIEEQILFFPTLESLKKAYPSVNIDVIVEPRAKSAYRICPSVNQVIPFDFKDRNSPADWANLLGIIRDRYYDIAISSETSWGIGLLLWLAGTPIRLGYLAEGKNLFFTHSVAYKPEQYAAQVSHDLLSALDIKASCPSLAISVPKGDIDWADAERKRLELGESGYVVMYGGVSDRAKPSSSSNSANAKYPMENWQTIIQDFQNRQPDLPIVLVQNEGVDSFTAELSRTCPGVKLTQPGEISQLAAMVAGANLLLCTNSIPMHLAVALGVYTLVLFGEDDPSKLLPKSDKFQAIQSSTGKIADISPQTVLDRVWGS